MVRLLLLILLVTFSSPAYSQQDGERMFFSEALAAHLPKYEEKAKDAYFYRNYEEAERLFDSLVNYNLEGSFMDNFQFTNLKGKEIELYSYKKPVYLMTYSSWVIMHESELEAINKLADKYQERIDFVMVYWDDKSTVKKISREFSKNVQVLYVNELKNQDSYVVSNLKHSLGLPTTFLMDGQKRILEIKRGISQPYGTTYNANFELNYNSIFDGIANHLLQDDEFNRKNEPFALN